MFEPLFILNVAVAFLVAGVWITLATVISERFGTKIGGLVANTPSNILVSLFFIGLTQTPEFAAKAASTVPVGMMIDTLFLFAFVLLVKRFGARAVFPALGVWAVLVFAFGSFGVYDAVWTTVLYVAVALACFWFLEKKMHILSMEKRNVKYTKTELLIRAVFSGAVVASAIIIAEILGPVWGGLFSVFPAVMLTTMYLITRSQGPDFSQATGKSMVLGSANIVVYAIAVKATFPVYGIFAGTVFSYFAAMAFVIFAYPFIKRIN